MARWLLPLAFLLLAAPSTIRAETITGVFRYTYPDPADGTAVIRPVVFSTVEIWTFRPRIFIPLVPPIWAWDKDLIVSTDASGAISVPMFNIPGTIYALRVFADNYAGSVFANKAVPDLFPFFAKPGEDDGVEIQRTITSPLDVLHFDFTFHGSSAQHYCLAEAVRHAFDYATAHRDPREAGRQPIPKVRVQPTSLSPTGTFYDPIGDRLIIDSTDVFQDLLVVHEYAHFLENHLSRFFPLPSNHDGCLATIAGAVVNSPEHAWMEGFADYFAAAVGKSMPGVFHGLEGIGTPSAGELEAPRICSGLPSWVTPDAVELRVAGVLWDLFDINGDIGVQTDCVDCLDRFQDLDGHGLTSDMAIMQIFDFELERLPGLAPPTLSAFSNAWVLRGLPVSCFNRILSIGPAPVCPTLNCPGNQLVTAAPRDRAAVVDYPMPTLSVALSEAVTIECTPPPGFSFPRGSTSVACRARDDAGDLARCGFSVTVRENPVVIPDGCAPVPMPAFYANFDYGLPPGAHVYGSAQVSEQVLKLTTTDWNQLGSLVLDDFLLGAKLSGFNAHFRAAVGGGTIPEGVGFSFNFASDLPDAPFGAAGAGNGLSVCFAEGDFNYNSPNISVKWQGNLIARRNINPLTGAGRFVDVTIQLHADGTLDVSWEGQTIFHRLATGYTPLAGARFGLGAQTAGLASHHWIDDLGISIPQRTGLVGWYYDNADFSGFRFARTDPAIDFDWGLGSPHPSIGPDGFAVRWTGQVVPRFTELYTFHIRSDDGVRLWVNNRLLVDNWSDHPLTENSGAVAMVAGQPSDIRLEYYENGGGAAVQLLWSSVSQPKEVVPSRQLIPHPLAGSAICGLFNTGVDAGGLPLADNAGDPHYALVYRDTPASVARGWTPVAATSLGGFPIGPWLDDNNYSAWTAPATDTVGANNYSGYGSFQYELHFDLTGQDPATTVLQGRWSVDNYGTDILLNGYSTGLVNNNGFTAWTSFVLDRGFVPGWNTLTFVVNNGYQTPSPDGPTGLRVEICGAAQSAPHLGLLAPPQAVDGGGRELTFGSQPGHRYCLQFKASLNDRLWTNLSCLVATEYATLIIDPTGSRPSRFYRVLQTD